MNDDLQVHIHRYCHCPPGYCSKTCLDCRVWLDAQGA